MRVKYPKGTKITCREKGLTYEVLADAGAEGVIVYPEGKLEEIHLLPLDMIECQVVKAYFLKPTTTTTTTKKENKQ